MDNPAVAVEPTRKPVTLGQAVAAQKALREQTQGTTNLTPTEAGRALAQVSAAARKSATAAQPEQSEGKPEEQTPEAQTSETTEQDNPDAEPAENADGQAEAEADSWSDETPIPLGDGNTVTLKEVKDGILRQADYTRKTMELSKRGKEFDATVNAKLSDLDNAISLASNVLGQEPDWTKVARDNGTDAAFQQKLAWDQNVKFLNDLRQKHATEQHQLIVQAKAKMFETLTTEYEPSWLDQSKAKQDFDAIQAYALDQGVTQQELALATNPAHIKIMHKAMLYDQKEKAKPAMLKKLNEKPKVVKPQARLGSQALKATELQKRQDNLRNKGSFTDALAIFKSRRQNTG